MNATARNTIILAAALVLLLVVWLLVRKEGATLDESETNFSVQDTAAVARIHLLARQQDRELFSTRLARREGYWALNDSLRAKPDAVNQLLTLLHRVRVSEPVHENARDNVFKYIKDDHIRVEVETADGEEKVFYVGGEAPAGYGTMAYMEGADNPYLTELPGMRGYIKPFFNANPVAWREVILFDVPPQAAREIRVEFAGADSSFTLRKTPEGWQFSDGASPDPAIMSRYLAQLGRVPAQANVEQELPGKRDSLRAQPPFARFTITPETGAPTSVVVYQREKKTISSFLGWVEGEDQLLVIPMHNFAGLLPPKRVFFPNGAEGNLP